MVAKTTKISIFESVCTSCRCTFQFVWYDTRDNGRSRVIDCPECNTALPARENVTVVAEKPVERALTPSCPDTTKDPY